MTARLEDRPEGAVRRGLGLIRALAGVVMLALSLSACTGPHEAAAPRSSTTTSTTVAPLLEKVPAGRIVPLPGPPVAVAVLPLSAEVVVATRDPASIIWLDEDGHRIASRPLSSAPGDVVAAGLAERVVVSLPAAGVVEEYDGPSRLRWRVRLGGDPGSLAVGGGDRVVVDDPAESVLFELRHGRMVAEQPVRSEPLIISASGSVCWTLERATGILEARPLSTLAPSGRLDVGRSATALVLGGTTGYVLDSSGRARVLSGLLHPRQVFLAALRPRSGALAFDPVAHLVWVAETARNTVASFDVAHGYLRRIGSFASLRAPDLAVVDSVSGVLAVASSVDAELELVSVRDASSAAAPRSPQ